MNLKTEYKNYISNSLENSLSFLRVADITQKAEGGGLG